MTAPSKLGISIGLSCVITFMWVTYLAMKKDAEIRTEVDHIAYRLWVQEHPNTRITFEEFQILRHHEQSFHP